MISQGQLKQFQSQPLVAADVLPGTRMQRFMRLTREVNDRERLRLRAEIMRIPGLMDLLMKPRNGERWSAEDRARLRAQLRGLGLIALYLTTLAIPGTIFTLPLLAWWLDRRRFRRGLDVSAGSADK